MKRSARFMQNRWRGRARLSTRSSASPSIGRVTLRRSVLFALVVGLIACGGPSTRLVTVRSGTGSGSVDFQVKNLTDVGINTFHLAKTRSEEHTSELQSQSNLVCRLLLEKKKKI